jgi:hypothetical protein
MDDKDFFRLALTTSKISPNRKKTILGKRKRMTSGGGGYSSPKFLAASESTRLTISAAAESTRQGLVPPSIFGVPGNDLHFRGSTLVGFPLLHSPPEPRESSSRAPRFLRSPERASQLSRRALEYTERARGGEEVASTQRHQC